MTSLIVCLIVWLKKALEGSVRVMVYPKDVWKVIMWFLIDIRMPIALAARYKPDLGPCHLSVLVLLYDSIL